MMRFFVSSLLFVLAVRADDCQPATWNAKGWEVAYTPNVPKRADGIMSTRTTLVTTADTGIQPGDVNCRYSATTSATVNYYTCTQMATKYGITVDTFFTLNPTLELDCSNIQSKTEYCVDGCKLPLSQYMTATCLAFARLTGTHSHRARQSHGPVLRPPERQRYVSRHSLPVLQLGDVEMWQLD